MLPSSPYYRILYWLIIFTTLQFCVVGCAQEREGNPEAETCRIAILLQRNHFGIYPHLLFEEGKWFPRFVCNDSMCAHIERSDGKCRRKYIYYKQ